MWLDLESDILEEFGRCTAQAGEENTWTAQAEAKRTYERERRWAQRQAFAQSVHIRPERRVERPCAECPLEAAPGRRLCGKHLHAASLRSLTYQRRVGGYPLSERAKAAVAESARRRCERRGIIT